MAKIESPWTEQQVEQLLIWQQNAPMHPFTCCGHNGCTRPPERNEGVLIPTPAGWICPCGDYKQDWAHDFMFEKSDVENKFERLKLTIGMIALAKAKGYDVNNGLFSPAFLEHWHDAATIFCNQACSVISWWLRAKHTFLIHVFPYRNTSMFNGYIYKRLYDEQNGFHTKLWDAVTQKETYEFAMLEAIVIALNTLPSIAPSE